MQWLNFSTDTVAPAHRLALFRAGAVSYQVDALGDPASFSAHWRVLRLGDVNVLHAHVSPVRYLRQRERIDADGEDRMVFFHIRTGDSDGVLDDEPIVASSGSSLMWDLTCPLEMRSPSGLDVVAVTLPRFMIEEALPGVTLSGAIAPSAALTLASEHLRFLFDHADALPDETAPFQGRALRDLLAMAIMPLYLKRGGQPHSVPALHRILEQVDREPAAAWHACGLAKTLALPLPEVAATVDRFGGLDALVERRRLLAAYRMLCDPAETAPVSVIAVRCGLTDMPRFSRRFRAVFHTTATDLRHHHRARLPRWAGAYHLEESYEPFRAG